MVNVSIIIPHYNTWDLLSRCIFSIPDREDIQIIVIDDGSPEQERYPSSSPELSRRNVELLLLNNNQGAGRARNEGLARAKGKWLVFADASDLFTAEIGEILDKYLNNTEDILFFRVATAPSDDLSLAYVGDNDTNWLLDDFWRTGNDTMLRCWHVQPWGKMIKRSLIKENNIVFGETKYSNDVLFSVLANCNASAIKVCDEVFYVVTTRPGSGSLSDSFNKKPGELLIRSAVMFEAQKILLQRGYWAAKMPLTQFMQQLYVENRTEYNKYFRQIKLAYPSVWCALKSIRTSQKGIINKLSLYIHSLLVLASKEQ